MSEDADPQVEPIHFTQHLVLTVSRWPARTAVTEAWLESPHVRQATFDPEADTVTFDIESGRAVYALRRDLDRHGGAIVADLIEERGPRGGLRHRADLPSPNPETDP
jgi:hypothetical protein